MERRSLAREIHDTALLRGDFELRSGRTSATYIDKYRFESNPSLLRTIAAELAKMLPEDIEILAGLELGGVPLATAMALETSLPVVFVRKEAKTYGTKKIAEGADVARKRVCIVEDVVTTGGQVIKSAEALRAEGAVVEWVTFVVSRGDGETNLKAAGLSPLSLLTLDDIMDSAS